MKLGIFTAVHPDSIKKLAKEAFGTEVKKIIANGVNSYSFVFENNKALKAQLSKLGLGELKADPRKDNQITFNNVLAVIDGGNSLLQRLQGDKTFVMPAKAPGIHEMCFNRP